MSDYPEVGESFALILEKDSSFTVASDAGGSRGNVTWQTWARRKGPNGAR